MFKNSDNGCMTVNTLNIKLHNLNRRLIWCALYISVKLFFYNFSIVVDCLFHCQ